MVRHTGFLVVGVLLALGCGAGPTDGGESPDVVVERVVVAGAPDSLSIGQEVALAAAAYAGNRTLEGTSFV